MERSELIPVAPRTELMELFDRLSEKRIIYIHAPAGYGKSFTTRMWLKRNGNVSAWITVNELAGRKSAEFCERVVTALLSLQPDNVTLREFVLHKSFATAPYEFMIRAQKAFSAFARDQGGQYILVVDDLHLITSPDTLKRIPEFIISLPESVTLFLLSRTEPSDYLSELVVKNMMAILNVNNLKFSENEIKSFFMSCGQSLTMQQAQDIKVTTDGWAIGLNALLLSGEKTTDRKLLIRYLETFIKDQIWGKWSRERRDFMLCVSVADELTPDFCNAMTGRKDSQDVLNMLVWENAFISVDMEEKISIGEKPAGGNVYRFQHLFRDFLMSMLERENDKLKSELYQKAGNWFYSQADYYKAVEYYIKCGDKNGITKGLKLMYNYNSPYAAVEDTLAIIRLSVNDSIVDDYPFLLEVQAWAAFVEGRGSDMEAYLARYFKQLPKIILLNPASAQTALLLRCMDYCNSMVDVTKSLKALPLKLFAKANTPSISQNMPLFHRSSRDFSEYALTGAELNFALLRKTIGVLVGDEYDVIEYVIRSGIAYECGSLNEAYELALTANIKLKDNFAPEIKFCSFLILAAILDAQGQRTDTQKFLDAAAAMIEHDKAYYLNANFRAFSCRLMLNDGDTDAAHDWLRHHAGSPYTELCFYKLYQHFTTARAYIVTRDNNIAIMFLKKLLALCEQYRRTLDVIEANVLLAIVYWKKERGQNEAIEWLERAIISAQVYGYTQIFADEGAELSNMLHRLQKRIVQKDSGGISVTYVKMLYIMALTRAKHSKGMTGGRIPENMTFTGQQKTVMGYMCEGFTQKEMAEKMGIKPSGVKSHVTLIYRKLDVSNSVDAMIKIRELGVLDE